jgi:hypothetical protein
MLRPRFGIRPAKLVNFNGKQIRSGGAHLAALLSMVCRSRKFLTAKEHPFLSGTDKFNEFIFVASNSPRSLNFEARP